MVLLAAGLVAAPCAVALTSPVEIQQAAQDVAGGTGTATESEEVNAVIDYLQAEFGVDPAKVSYQTITDGSGTTRTWSSDPAVQDLQGATDNALSGGSIEAAAGGELASAAEDTGVVSLLEEGGGVVCASSVGCAIAAGGVAAAIFVGPKLVEFFTGSGEQQNNNASSGICPYHVNQAQICGLQVPTKEIKVWCPVSPVSAGWDAATLSCTTTGVNNGPATRPSLWGGARNMNVDSSMPPCASAYPCVPTADVVNGGAWFLMEQWPDGSWSYGTSGFPAPGSDTSQCNGTTWNNYEFAWTAPPPGGPGSSSRWI